MAATVAGGGTVAAQNEVRFQQYDQQMSQLTGQIEQLELKINDIADKFDRMQKDTEFRLAELEKKSGGGMPMAAPIPVRRRRPALRATWPRRRRRSIRRHPRSRPSPASWARYRNEQMQNLPQALAGAADQAAAGAGGVGRPAGRHAAAAIRICDRPRCSAALIRKPRSR